jgi:Zn-dependent protease with chaperone function
MDDVLPASTDEPAAGQLTPAQIAAAFQGGVPRARVSVLYQLGLIIVAITMVLLPLIYLMLVGAAVWGVYSWATYGTFLFGGIGGIRGTLVVLVLYLIPLFAGIVVVFFMIKPLLARRAPAARPLGLNPEMQPVLFALIRCICDEVGAPFPKRVYVDCQLNAAAGFRRGLLSFFGDDLMLVIGLPLVAGLSARQLAGVLAHEFGHFTQGVGMRLTYLIRAINMWFARIAYERDAWDVMLDQWAGEAEDWRVVLIVNLARLAVWFSRLILRILLHLGHAIGCFMLRQMEYDADSWEINLAGSDTFESATKRLHVLGAASARSYKEMRVGWNLNKRLPEDFPAYLMSQERAMKPAAKTHLEDTAGLGLTGIFDTHPSDGDRIRRARRAEQPGVFGLEAPATALFSDFEVLSKQVSQLHYKDDLGIPVVMAKLCPVKPQVRVVARERRNPSEP